MGTPTATTSKQKYFASYTDVKIETTATPNDLFYALQDLTDAQKSDIRDMGFESIMSFNIRNIPMGLGRWSLDNYDHKRNELKVGSHKIEVTTSKVHDVFGVPMGKIPVFENKRGKKSDIIREEWRKQFSNTVYVKDVIKKLISYKKGGMLFKLNFLVLFNSIMGETGMRAVVNRKFLSSIKNEGDISNMDWCGYIITCLKRTKEGWNGKEPYNGPLTFLAVLYAHEQQLRRSPEKAITPAIKYVTTGFLIDFEASMHVDNIQDENHITQNVEVQVKSETHVASAEGHIAVDQNLNVQQDKEDEIQLQNEKSQTSVNQNVNMQQDKEDEDQIVNIPQDEEDGDRFQDDDVVILEPKQEQSALVENVSHMSDSVEKDESGMVSVKGYKVKRGVANILKSILKKHGDIAAKCVLKSNDMRSPFLEAVCEVALWIQASYITASVEDLESRVSDAKAVKIDVSWLEPHFKKWKEATKMYNLLMKMKPNHLSVIKSAESNLKKRRAELEAAEERSRQAKRLVEALRLVGKNQTDNFFESKAKIDSWLMDSIV